MGDEMMDKRIIEQLFGISKCDEDLATMLYRFVETSLRNYILAELLLTNQLHVVKKKNDFAINKDDVEKAQRMVKGLSRSIAEKNDKFFRNVDRVRRENRVIIE